MRKVVCRLLRLYVRHFPLRKGKIPLLRLFELLGFFKGVELETNICSRTRVFLKLDDWVQRLVYFFGVYEFEKAETRCWLNYSKNSKSILDIGSNFGYYTLLACDQNDFVKVLAFEPAPDMFNRLSHNLRLNNYLDRVSTLNIGLSDKKGRFDFFVADDKHSGMSGLSMPEGVSGKRIQVEVDTVDSILSNNGSLLPDLVKIDVEGNELNVLNGMKHTLLTTSPVFFIEIYDKNLSRFGHSSQQVFDFFWQHRYQVFEVQKNGQLSLITSPKDIGLAICIPSK